MPRQQFYQEMQRLQDELLSLGSAVENALRDSVICLQERDYEGSRALMAADWEINTQYYDIEQGCLTLIATQQPMAGDLRMLASILTIAAELERIGDYAKGIAKINLLIGDQPLLKPLVDIPRMAEKAQGMLRRSLVAFSRRDVAMARTIPREDDQVDNLYNQVYRELFTYMLQNPENINQGNYLLWAAHNLERAADRCSNICQRVIYSVTGQVVNLEAEAEEIGSPLAPSEIEPLQTRSRYQ